MPSESSSLDPVPVSLIKDCIDELALTMIANDSFAIIVITFPRSCKSALVRPLIKKANLDRNTLKNYRPVSNCSFLDKFPEKCAFEQLNSYLVYNSLWQISICLSGGT